MQPDHQSSTPGVESGRARKLVDDGPFDLLVLDGGGKGKDPDLDSPLDPSGGWLALGGMIVLDDFIPSGEPGAELHDPAREHWLNHPCLKATEIRLSPTLATIVGVRVRQLRAGIATGQGRDGDSASSKIY